MKTARTDNTSLITGRAVTGNRGLGVLGQNVSSVAGPQGTSPLYDSLDLPADNLVEVRWYVVTWPTLGGVLQLTEDGKLYYSGPPDTCVIGTKKAGVSQGTATLTFTNTSLVYSDLTITAALAALVNADLTINPMLSALVFSDLTANPNLAALVRADLIVTAVMAALVRADLQVVPTLQSDTVVARTPDPTRIVTFDGGKRTVAFDGGKRLVRF